jgi:hypothetical protein
VIQSTTTPTTEAADDQKRIAAVIKINDISDKPLRAGSAYIKDPATVQQKLRERYASTNLSTRMSLMAELQTRGYKSSDLTEFVDKYTALLDRLEAMDENGPSDLAVILSLHLLYER